ncbi:mucin-2 [Heteronotia binoei]|uniref:mucin-2 n=1 Tax=Heteronotia binoei TaxID=13085 RepID=UPI0029304DF7|nr:mucin-2 [Heteronotia binoei]
MGKRLPSLLILWLALCYASEIKKGRDPNHGHYVCSTWGNNHFKTFDGDFYQFPGLCDYNFASDCQESYKEFSVHIQRELNDQGHPDIQYVLVTVKDVAIYFTHKMVVVDGQIVRTPYYSSGILIEKTDIYTKMYARVGMVLLWNREDALMFELDAKFNNKTCGLCGDYNGQPIYNEFLSNGLKYNPITFGNLQKINKPNVVCEDPDETQTVPLCDQHREECEALLTAPAFEDCKSRLNLEQYIQACMQDKCACQQVEDSFCLCSTVSEYSRQCSHSGGKPQNWRTSQFCPKSCPGNMIYMESGSPCMDSCSHLEISSLCEEHYMDGCFCPEGTVYDDITGKGCVATSQCSCKLHGNLYSPGQNITNECENCTCQSGRWICQDLPCPGTCALEGGAHITTFDGKKYTFHGDCYYVLTKSSKNDSYVLLGELGPCGSTDKQTCLKMVVLLTDHKQNIVVFKPDGTVLLNENEVHLPHVSASFSVFQPSSYHIIVETKLGLKLQIQLVPIMQLFVIADQSVKGVVQGLCGNFNGIEGDDFKTSGGMVEATGSAFANTWKAQSSCTDKVDKLEHPCTLNLENENYAEHWCSLLKSSEGPFARCHSAIDPADYYKRCKYDTCSCHANEECLCAALSSYARACAFKGVMLWGWRNVVCNNEVSSCPATQVFRYNLTVCQQTCRSLSEGDKHCLQGFIPVDGCGCPDSSYLNDKGVCVPIDQCPCYYKGSFIKPGGDIMKQEEHCVCHSGKLKCVPVAIPDHDCSPNKTYFDCNKIDSWSSQTPVQLSCQTLGTAHFQTECISGCVCHDGLIDDGRGGCVKEENCPCIHNKEFYAPGERIDVDCNECTCQNGNWACTKFVCYGTCIIYGSGHYITFDGKYYDFDGKCEYVASQDYCGLEQHQGSFSIITENVPCGTTGVTCSKAIKVFLGRTELKLEDKQKVEITRDSGNHVRYWTRNIGLYLVIEASNGVMLNWDKKTTIFIKLTPNYKGKVCGLCGNFDDKANNDFTTRSQVQASNALDFGNSWKRDSACPDIDADIEPCDQKPHRKSWAEKECSLIKSEVFAVCHPKVDPKPFYEACVHDACACDSGGDCECFCTAVAAYAQECIKAEACVFWRTPDICPIFCDYYNPTDICEWHYEPCGRDIMTCKMLNNIATNFSVPYLEGCYPRCPPEKPIFNEETFTCVTEDLCGCYVGDTHYENGSVVPTDQLCMDCICLETGQVNCEYDKGDIISVERNGSFCFNLTCGENGAIEYTNVSLCVSSTTTVPTTTISMTTSSTTFTTTSVSSTTFTTTSVSSTTKCYEICQWSQWYDVSFPKDEPGGGDYETYEAIRIKDESFCSAPQNIECRAKDSPEQSLEELGQKVECNVTYGLICRNEDQDKSLWNLCYNYEIRVNCCYCGTPSTTTITTTTLPTTTTTPSTTAPTTTSIPTTTTTQTTSAVCTPSTEICEWSEWIDVSYPLHGPQGGDYETYDIIRGHGIEVCGNPLNISCRAVKFPELSFQQLQQNVECDVSTGLVCNNKDQVPGPVMPDSACLNYEISIYCCRIICTTITTSTAPSSTTTTTTTPSTTTTATTTPSTTSESTTSTTTSLPTTTTTATPTPTTPTSTTPTPETPTTTTTSPPTTTTTSTPTPSTPSTTSESTTSTVTTTTPSTTTTATTTPSTTSESTTSTTTSLPTTTTTATPTPTTPTSTTPTPETPTTTTTSPPTTTTTSTPTPSTPSTTSESTTSTVTTTTPSTTTTATTTPSTTSESTTSTTTSLPTTTPTATPTPTTPTSTTPTPETPTTTTTSPPTTTTTSTPTPSTPSTTSGSTTAVCTPSTEICEWSEWIDVSYPLHGPQGGDYETYDIIREHGIEVCGNPLNISCRAVKFPELSFQQLQQNVECDVSTGLVCNNKDQVPGPVMPDSACLNYEISIYCCRIICTTITTSTAPSSTTTTTTTPSTTTTATTTPSTTSESTTSTTTSLPTTTTTATPTPTTPTSTTPTPETPTTTTTSPPTTTTTSTPTPSTPSTTSESTTSTVTTTTPSTTTTATTTPSTTSESTTSMTTSLPTTTTTTTATPTPTTPTSTTPTSETPTTTTTSPPTTTTTSTPTPSTPSTTSESTTSTVTTTTPSTTTTATTTPSTTSESTTSMTTSLPTTTTTATPTPTTPTSTTPTPETPTTTTTSPPTTTTTSTPTPSTPSTTSESTTGTVTTTTPSTTTTATATPSTTSESTTSTTTSLPTTTTTATPTPTTPTSTTPTPETPTTTTTSPPTTTTTSTPTPSTPSTTSESTTSTVTTTTPSTTTTATTTQSTTSESTTSTTTSLPTTTTTTTATPTTTTPTSTTPTPETPTTTTTSPPTTTTTSTPTPSTPSTTSESTTSTVTTTTPSTTTTATTTLSTTSESTTSTTTSLPTTTPTPTPTTPTSMTPTPETSTTTTTSPPTTTTTSAPPPSTTSTTSGSTTGMPVSTTTPTPSTTTTTATTTITTTTSKTTAITTTIPCTTEETESWTPETSTVITTTPTKHSSTTSTTPTTTTSTQTPSTTTAFPTTTPFETSTTTLPTTTPTETSTTTTSTAPPFTTTETTSTTPTTTTTSTQTPSTTTASPTTTPVETSTTTLPTTTPTETSTTSTATPFTTTETTSTTPTTTTTSTQTPSTTTASPTTTPFETSTTTLPTTTPTETSTTTTSTATPFTTTETTSTTTSTTPATTTTSTQTPSTTTASPTTTPVETTTTTLPTTTPTETSTTTTSTATPFTTTETTSTTTSTTPATTTTSTQTPSTTTASPTTTPVETTTLPTTTPTETSTTTTSTALPHTTTETTSTTPTTTTTSTQTPSTTTASPTTTPFETSTTTLPTTTPTETSTTTTSTALPHTTTETTSTTPTTTTTSTQTPSTTTASPTTTPFETSTTTLPTTTPTETSTTTTSTATPFTTTETTSTTTSTTPATTTTSTQTPSTTTASPTTTPVETTTTTLPTTTPTETSTTTTSTATPFTTTETTSTTTSTTPATTTTSTQTPSTTTASPTTTPVETTTLPTTTPTETSTTTTSTALPHTTTETTSTTPTTTTTSTQTPSTTTASPTTTPFETSTTTLPTTTPTETSTTTTSTALPHTTTETTSTTPTTTTTSTQTPSTTTASPTTTPFETSTTTLPTTTPTETSTTTTSTATPFTTTETTSTTTSTTSATTTTSTQTPSTTTASPTTTPVETPTSTTASSTKFHEVLSPKPGEFWWICNCTQAICVENDTWHVVPVECVPPPEPQCSNGLAPVQVIDDNGCCWHWECDCYCTGWGDPHYKTFDGLYYSYQGNCTYTLVEEINKNIDNFGVYIDNYHCDPREPVSCPRTLIVRHETQEVRITTVREVPLKVQVLVNGQTVALPYKKYGLKVYESGVNQVVEIPELKMNVTYNGMAFTIRLPYQLFGNNTQGQCGTCTNNTADDCRLRNGTLASTCEVMADNWIVNDPSKPQCIPLLPPSGPPTIPPLHPCKPSPLCELLQESVFKKCHEAVDPRHYYAACLFDSCRIPDRNIECATLQIYAATCADQGVCIDWRNDTNGLCPIQCPSGKNYKACGPSVEETCKSGSLTGVNETQVEGCFCPAGTTLYDSGVDICVETCGCVGPDNIPRAFGETFQFDCKDCVCLEGGAGIVCENHKCPPALDEPECEAEGFHKISEVNPDDKCCSKTTCVCNVSDCTIRPPTCELGFEAVSHTPPSRCCPVYQCGPKGVCVHNGAEYKPGSKVLGGECQDCVCTYQKNITTNLNIIDCDHIPCNTSCEPPGAHRNDPNDNCTIYSCVSINRQLISSTSTINCPPLNENRCQPGTVTYSPNGCCKTCIFKETPTPPPCSLTVTNEYITYNGCTSVERVSVTQCQGTCGTFSLYSAEANSMQHKCSCCREEKTSKKAVTMACPDGSSQTHFYLHVESCKCLNTECNETASSEQTSVKRRRRQLTRK